MTLMRLLSTLASVRLERVERLHGPLELTLENGRLVVNSAHANQSFGSLHRVWQKCFADIDLVRHRPTGCCYGATARGAWPTSCGMSWASTPRSPRWTTMRRC